MKNDALLCAFACFEFQINARRFVFVFMSSCFISHRGALTLSDTKGDDVVCSRSIKQNVVRRLDVAREIALAHLFLCSALRSKCHASTTLCSSSFDTRKRRTTVAKVTKRHLIPLKSCPNKISTARTRVPAMSRYIKSSRR